MYMRIKKAVKQGRNKSTKVLKRGQDNNTDRSFLGEEKYISTLSATRSRMKPRKL